MSITPPPTPTADASQQARRAARAALDATKAAAVADAMRIVAVLSLAAGAIHAIAMVDHFAHYWLYGVFFLAVTYGQVLWGVALLRGRVGDRGLALGAYANLAIVGVWLFSRTLGVPIGPQDTPEPVGVMDVAATLDQSCSSPTRLRSCARACAALAVFERCWDATASASG
jgi:hypothetical protein